MSFTLLLEYSSKLQGSDLAHYICLQISDETQEFEGIFIALAPLWNAVKYLRYFVRVDATYILLKFKIVLVITVVIDANDEILLICWALLPKEDEKTWK